MTDAEIIADRNELLLKLWGAVVEAYMLTPDSTAKHFQALVKIDRALRERGLLPKGAA